jgi:hypothetical protein
MNDEKHFASLRGPMKGKSKQGYLERTNQSWEFCSSELIHTCCGYGRVLGTTLNCSNTMNLRISICKMQNDGKGVLESRCQSCCAQSDSLSPQMVFRYDFQSHETQFEDRVHRLSRPPHPRARRGTTLHYRTRSISFLADDLNRWAKLSTRSLCEWRVRIARLQSSQQRGKGSVTR